MLLILSYVSLIHILQLLEYTLKKNHPNCPGKLAQTLLVLPLLREHSVWLRGRLYTGRKDTNPPISPLLNEVFEKTLDSQSVDTDAEETNLI